MMKMISVYDSVGCILSHDVTQVIPGEFRGKLFKRGHIVGEEDIEKLLSTGKEHICIWEPSEGELHGNDVAIRISNLILGDGACKSEEMREGKVGFFADIDGVLKIGEEELFKLNSLGEIIISTLHSDTLVKRGEEIGPTRVIPLMIDEDRITNAGKLIKDKIIYVEEVKPKNCLLITTGNEVYSGRIKDAFLPVVKSKLGCYSSEVINQVTLLDSKERIIEKMKNGLSENVDVTICAGGMSVDPDDITPAVIKGCGGGLVTYGSPVLPGAMSLLAHYKDIPILRIPSCAMYSKKTVLDLILPRILADERLTSDGITDYGHGGLCLDYKVCTFPHYSLGE